MSETTLDCVLTLAKEMKRAERDVTRTSEARRRLPIGSTRARVTTANARWASACEERQRLWDEMESLVPGWRDECVYRPLGAP